jgi:hypothetical protein
MKCSKKMFKIYFLILLILGLLFNKNKEIIILKSFKDIKVINVNKFFELKDKSKDPNDLLILKEKESFFHFISNISRHKITSVDTIFLTQNYKFGNIIIILNKVLFYCEIIKCKRIILNKKKTWYIKKKIVNPEYNISIEVGDPKKYDSRNTIFDTSDIFLYYYAYIKPEFRAHFLRNEILSNLPKVQVDFDDLFIYIRSGDIFKINNNHYAQPPLCFYKSIIDNNNNFTKIYIIAQNNINPVINKLIEIYPRIIFHINSLRYDIAYLINAFNIVGAVSTFINIIIRFNDNLKYFWEYNIDSDIVKIINFHHSLYKPFKNITYLRMEPSKRYINEMSNWNHTQFQINLMITEQCINNFTKINEFTLET